MKQTPRSSWMNAYQEQNPEPFNQDLINLRKRDEENLPGLLHNIGKLLEVIDGVEFLGCDINFNEATFDKRRNGIIPIEESRFIQANLQFKVGYKGESDITMRLFLPRLVDDYYFHLNGSNYSAIYQIVDRGTYSTGGNRSSLKLKTLLMPTELKLGEDRTFSTVDGTPITGDVFTTDLFKSENNLLYYFFAEMGVEDTIDFFGFSDSIGFINMKDDDLSEVDFLKFKINSKEIMWAQKDAFLDQHEVNFLVTLVDMFTGGTRINIEKMDERKYWLRQLGRLFSKNTNTQVSKAEKILLSLRRILDETTKQNLAHVDASDKETIFHILRWMAINQDRLVREDGMDLRNKRMRLYEYILYPLVLRFSNITYSLVNKRNLTHEAIVKAIKSVDPTYVVKRLTSGRTKLIRYSSCVNGMDLFASCLKWTMRGPQSMGESSSTDVAVNHRDLHHSYVGRVGLISASASDPGMGGTMTPFCETSGMFFDLNIGE